MKTTAVTLPDDIAAWPRTGGAHLNCSRNVWKECVAGKTKYLLISVPSFSAEVQRSYLERDALHRTSS